MTITQAFSTKYLASAQNLTYIEEIAQRGIYAIFRTKPMAVTYTILEHLERKDRAVLLLLDGKRTLQDVARLTHRTELEIAYILVRFLRRGYIEFLPSPEKDHVNP